MPRFTNKWKQWDVTVELVEKRDNMKYFDDVFDICKSRMIDRFHIKMANTKELLFERDIKNMIESSLKNGILFVAKKGGNTIGYIDYIVSKEEKNVIEISTPVAKDPEFEEQLGWELILMTIRDTVELGADYKTHCPSGTFVDIYKKLRRFGFKVEGEKPEEISSEMLVGPVGITHNVEAVRYPMNIKIDEKDITKYRKKVDKTKKKLDEALKGWEEITNS